MNFGKVFRVSSWGLKVLVILSFLFTGAFAQDILRGVSGISIASGSSDRHVSLGKERDLSSDVAAVAPQSLVPQWHAMKKQIEERYRFSFNLAYSALYQRSSDTFEGDLAGTRELREIYDYLNLSPPTPGLQDEATGGIAEFSGKWFVVGRDRPNAGFIGFELENRHRLGTAVNPQTLFIDNGSIWPTGTAFGEFDTALLSLYYEGFTSDKRFGSVPASIFHFQFMISLASKMRR